MRLLLVLEAKQKWGSKTISAMRWILTQSSTVTHLLQEWVEDIGAAIDAYEPDEEIRKVALECRHGMVAVHEDGWLREDYGMAE